MDKNARIYVAGSHTAIGAAIYRQLQQRGYPNCVAHPGAEPDLTDAAAVSRFFAEQTPEYVFVAAGKSGGILANQNYPADFILDNLLVSVHVIHQAYRHGVKKLLYLASSCSYPKHSPQPMSVSSLWSGPLEPTNQAYAVAKLAGLEMCRAYRQQYGVDFITAIPANAFGVDDEFDLNDSHVIPALIRRFHEAKMQNLPKVQIWGTGTPRREFIFADDLADACIFVMDRYSQEQPINLGGGADVSIRQLAESIRTVVGYAGELDFDNTKPDGMPLKALDATELHHLGWQASTSLEAAIAATYQHFLRQYS